MPIAVLRAGHVRAALPDAINTQPSKQPSMQPSLQTSAQGFSFPFYKALCPVHGCTCWLGLGSCVLHAAGTFYLQRARLSRLPFGC